MDRMNELMRKEIQEAVTAGEEALYSLGQAQKCLKSAGNWGVLDIFGGGSIVGLIKHSKINNASHYIEQARRDLKAFERELQDVDGYVDNIDVGGFLTFADFFFDGFVADMLVQSKIAKMKRQVAEAIDRVAGIVSRLKYQL